MPERVGLSLMNQIVARQRQKAEGATAMAKAPLRELRKDHLKSLLQGDLS